MKVKLFFKNNYRSLLFFLALIIIFYIINLYNYLLYHSLVELFSVVVAFSIFTIAWNSKKYFDNDYFLFIGIAYLFVGFLDFLHMLSYKGMGIFLSFPGSNLSTQLWIAARYIESLSLLAALFFIRRKYDYRIQIAGYSAVSILILISVFYWRIFPDCFIEGTGLTSFKIISEYVISFILLAAVFLIHLYRKEFDVVVFRFFVISIFMTIVSEIFFTLYFDVYGIFNLIGHLFKAFSFIFIYLAIIETGLTKPLNFVFFKLKQKEEELSASEEKFKSLYSSMTEGVSMNELVFDKDGIPLDYIIIDINDSFRQVFGLEGKRVMGKKASEVYDMKSPPYLDKYSEVVRSKKPVYFEDFSQKLGKYFSVSVSSMAEKRFAAIFSDITERKRFEKEVENLSRFPLENPNPVLRLDRGFRVIFSNKTGEIILKHMGYEKGKKLSDYIRGLEDKQDETKKVEYRVGKETFELDIVPINSAEYYNIYGMNITKRLTAEKFRAGLIKKKVLNRERNKIARELHDTVSQTLFASNLISESITRSWKKDHEKAVKNLKKVRDLNSSALMEMRTLLYELMPLKISRESLKDLIKRLADIISLKYNIKVYMDVHGDHDFGYNIKHQVYRIAQETFNNIVKHSKASIVKISLELYPEELSLVISDNGIGFDIKNENPRSFGLYVMNQRSRESGFTLDIKSKPGSGTKVELFYSKEKKSTKKRR